MKSINKYLFIVPSLVILFLCADNAFCQVKKSGDRVKGNNPNIKRTSGLKKTDSADIIKQLEKEDPELAKLIKERLKKRNLEPRRTGGKPNERIDKGSSPKKKKALLKSKMAKKLGSIKKPAKIIAKKKNKKKCKHKKNCKGDKEKLKNKKKTKQGKKKEIEEDEDDDKNQIKRIKRIRKNKEHSNKRRGLKIR